MLQDRGVRRQGVPWLGCERERQPRWERKALGLQGDDVQQEICTGKRGRLGGEEGQ